jgi:HEAT repeat protein
MRKGEKITVAILAGNNDVHRVASELEAKLSADPEIKLLPREQISKVMKENSAKFSGHATPAELASIGKLLAAELTVMLDSPDGDPAGKKENAFLRIRAIENATGVVIASHACLLPAKPNGGIDGVEKTVRLAVSKMHPKMDNRYFLASLGFHPLSADIKRDLHTFCNALPVLVANDLGESPNIIILDRQEMKLLGDEGRLTGKETHFQTSELFFDGEVSLNFDGKFIVDSKLRNNDGTTFKSFKVIGDSITEIRRKLTELIIKGLNSKSPALYPINPKEESKICWMEVFARLGDNLKLSAELAEAALALDESESNRELAAVFWEEICYRHFMQMGKMPDYEIREKSSWILDTAIRQFELSNEIRKPEEYFQTHEYLTMVTDEFKPPLRFAAMGNEKSWQKWLELKKLHILEYKKYIDRLSTGNDAGGKQKILAETARLIPYFKYWTEDPKEWDKILKDAFELLDDGIKDEDTELRVSRAMAYGTFHQAGSLMINQPVTLKEPGEDKVQEIYLERAENHTDPLVRIIAYDIFIRSEISPDKYSRKLLDTYIMYFPPDSVFHYDQYTVFPGLSGALKWIRYKADFNEANGYFTKVIKPKITKEYIRLLVFSQFIFEQWINLLSSNGRYDEASEHINELRTLLNDFIANGHVPDEMKNYLKNHRAGYNVYSLDSYFKHSAKSFLKSLDKLDETIAEKTGRETPPLEVPHVPEGLKEYEIREIPMKNIINPSSLRGNYYGNRNEIIRDVVFFIQKDILERVIIVPRPGNRLLVYLYHIPIEGGKIRSERAEINHRPDMKLVPEVLHKGGDLWIYKLTGGVIRFGKDGPKIFTAADGLPSDIVTVFDTLGGKMYIGTGKSEIVNLPGSMVEYDPETKRQRVICSNASTVKRSMLDGGEAYSVSSVIADEGNNCVLFTVNPNRKDADVKIPQKWKYELKSQNLESVDRIPPIKKETCNFSRFPIRAKDVRIGGRTYHSNSAIGFLEIKNGKDKFSLTCLPGGNNFEKISTGIPFLEQYDDSVIFYYGKLWQMRIKRSNVLDKGWQNVSAGYNASNFAVPEMLQKAREKVYHASDESYREAKTLYDKILAVSPNKESIYIEMSKQYYNSKRYDDAIDFATRAIQFDPDCLDAYFTRSLIHIAKKDYSNAYSDMKKAKEIGPSDHVIEEKLASISKQLELQKNRPPVADAKGGPVRKNISMDGIDFPDLSEKDRKFVLNLLPGLQNPDPKNRLKTISELRRFASLLAPAVPLLTSCLNDEASMVKSEIVFLLGRTGPAAKEVLPQLLPMSESKDDGLRQAAAFSIACIAPQNEQVIDALIKLIDDPKEPVMCSAIRGLGDAGTAAKKALPAIRKRMENLTDLNRLNAIEAIAKIENDYSELVDEYMKGLSDKESIRRELALSYLGSLGPNACKAVPEIIRVLDDEDDNVRRLAPFVLGRIGPEAKEAVPRLEKCYQSDDMATRQNAAFALWRISGNSGKDGEYKKTILTALSSSNFNTVLTGLDILKALGSMADDREITTALQVVLQNDNPDLRAKAELLMSKIKPEK